MPEKKAAPKEERGTAMEAVIVSNKGKSLVD
jgi:hypothetical protein